MAVWLIAVDTNFGKFILIFDYLPPEIVDGEGDDICRIKCSIHAEYDNELEAVGNSGNNRKKWRCSNWTLSPCLTMRSGVEKDRFCVNEAIKLLTASLKGVDASAEES